MAAPAAADDEPVGKRSAESAAFAAKAVVFESTDWTRSRASDAVSPGNIVRVTSMR
jgi:hypothetical protein